MRAWRDLTRAYHVKYHYLILTADGTSNPQDEVACLLYDSLFQPYAREPDKNGRHQSGRVY